MPPKSKLSDDVIADFEKWIATGGSKGGFLSTHPGTSERVEALQNLK